MGLVLPEHFSAEERDLDIYRGIVSPTMPTPGQPRGGEELDLQNAVQALLNEFNGNIDAANLKDLAVPKVKLATDALNAFLKLATAADIRLDFGVFTYTPSYGGLSTFQYDVTHSLKDAAGNPKVPTVVLATPSSGVAGPPISGPDEISMTVLDGSFTTTKFTVRGHNFSGGAMNFPGIRVYYLAIG